MSWCERDDGHKEAVTISVKQVTQYIIIHLPAPLINMVYLICLICTKSVKNIHGFLGRYLQVYLWMID